MRYRNYVHLFKKVNIAVQNVLWPCHITLAQVEFKFFAKPEKWYLEGSE